mmetsp:Transcript_22966/g.54246  ORF Transcript_22966/g.54246 Transcript_22966/m.54246 type:complete len:133 (+) Transcript_22966:2-400(+)
MLISDPNELVVVETEFTLRAHHDARLVQLALHVAKEQNVPMRPVTIPFGATDAAAFTLAGLRATTLCTLTDSLPPAYHTRYDDMAHLNAESVDRLHSVVNQMVLSLIHNNGTAAFDTVTDTSVREEERAEEL